MMITIEEAIKYLSQEGHYSKQLFWATRDHCLDTYLLVLDALRKAESILGSEYPATDGSHPSKCGVSEAINKASFVEVPE
jgi:hypothetical protein